MKLEMIDSKYEDCIEKVINYLRSNNIDIDKDIDEIEELNTLQKINYLIETLPSCNELELENNPSPSSETPMFSSNKNINNLEITKNIKEADNTNKDNSQLIKNILITILVFVILIFIILGIMILISSK